MWKVLNILIAVICPVIAGLVGIAIVWWGHNKDEGFILIVVTLYYFNLRVSIRNQNNGAWWA